MLYMGPRQSDAYPAAWAEVLTGCAHIPGSPRFRAPKQGKPSPTSLDFLFMESMCIYGRDGHSGLATFTSPRDWDRDGNGHGIIRDLQVIVTVAKCSSQARRAQKAFGIPWACFVRSLEDQWQRGSDALGESLPRSVIVEPSTAQFLDSRESQPRTLLYDPPATETTGPPIGKCACITQSISECLGW